MSNNNDSEKFWATNPCDFFKTMNILPSSSMDIGTKLNALTRLVVLIYIGLVLFNQPYSSWFLLLSLCAICVAYLFLSNKSKVVERYGETLSQNNLGWNWTGPRVDKGQYPNISSPIPISTGNTPINPKFIPPIRAPLTYGIPEITYDQLATAKTVVNGGNGDVYGQRPGIDLNPAPTIKNEIPFYSYPTGVNPLIFQEPIVYDQASRDDTFGNGNITRNVLNKRTFTDVGMSTSVPSFADTIFEDTNNTPTISVKTHLDNLMLNSEQNFVPRVMTRNTVVNDNTVPTSGYSYTGDSGKIVQSGPEVDNDSYNSLAQDKDISFRNDVEDRDVGGQNTDEQNTVSEHYSSNKSGFCNEWDELDKKEKKEIKSLSKVMKPTVAPDEWAPIETGKDIKTSINELLNDDTSRIFIQPLAPNLYTVNTNPRPINKSLGISYTHDIHEPTRDSVAWEGKGHEVFYARPDPSLIRKDGNPTRISEMPPRSSWSEETNGFLHPKGSINIDTIYEHHDGTKGMYADYDEISVGDLQYYTQENLPFIYPNFISRSKIDVFEFTDPNGKVRPEYNHHVSLNDIREQVNNKWMEDSMFQRENLMESLLWRRSNEAWTTRVGPIFQKGGYK